MTRCLALTFVLTFVLMMLASCTVRPADGTERGRCRPDGTCDQGLSCLSDYCVVDDRLFPDEGPGPRECPAPGAAVERDQWLDSALLGSAGGSFAPAIVVDARRPTEAYVITNTGVLRSEDCGATWAALDGAPAGIVTMSIGPAAGTLVAGAGTVWIGSRRGEVWTQASRSLPLSSVTGGVRDGDTLVLTGIGAAESTDLGASWSWLDVQNAIDVVKSDDGLVFIAPGALTRLDDDGTTVTPNPGPFFGDIAVAPSSDQTLYATTVTGIRKSTDGGRSWTEPFELGAIPGGAVRLIEVDAVDPDLVYVGQPLGSTVQVSSDGGQTFTTTPARAAVFNNRSHGLAAHPTEPGVVVAMNAGQQYTSTDGGLTWVTEQSDVPDATIVLWAGERLVTSTAAGAIFVDGEDTGVVGSLAFAALSDVYVFANGVLSVLEDGAPPLVPLSAEGPSPPSLLVALAPETLIAVGTRSGRTTNGGETWERYDAFSGSALRRTASTVVGLDGLRLRVSTDGGDSFSGVLSLDPFSGFASNEASDDVYLWRSAAVQLHRSRDGGVSFDQVGEPDRDDLPSAPVSAMLALDGLRGDLYAYSSSADAEPSSVERAGLLRSTDGGEIFEKLADEVVTSCGGFFLAHTLVVVPGEPVSVLLASVDYCGDFAVRRFVPR